MAPSDQNSTILIAGRHQADEQRNRQTTNHYGTTAPLCPRTPNFGFDPLTMSPSILLSDLGAINCQCPTQNTRVLRDPDSSSFGLCSVEQVYYHRILPACSVYSSM